jgi:uncharacterized protein
LALRKDPLFALALLAGIFVWWVLWFFFPSTPIFNWPLEYPLRFLTLAFSYPLIEELFFRGLLQPTLYQKSWGHRNWLSLSIANWLTSLLFMLAHFYAHPPLAAISVLIPSLIFGAFRDRYHSLTPALLLHIFYNAGYFWLFGAPN